MKLTILDEKYVFQPNDNLTVKRRKVGDDYYVIIDNFYKRPELVRELALSSPVSKQTGYLFGAYGARFRMGYDLSSLASIFHNISTSSFNFASKFNKDSFVKSMKELHFTGLISCIEDYNSQIGPNKIPHIDAYRTRDNEINFEHGTSGIAGLIYLNTPEECEGGTAFWKYKNSQHLDRETPPNEDVYLCESQGDWELIHVAEMKWNRLIMYPIDLLHNPFITQTMKFDGNPTYRIIQSLMT